MASNRRELEREKAKSLRDRKTMSIPGSIEKSVTPESRDIATNISETTYKTVYKFGTIHQVLPLGGTLLVAVLKTSQEDSLGHDENETLFNSFFLDPGDSPLLASMIPLANFDQELFQIPLDDLIGKKVKVKLLDDLYATEAELVSITDYDYSHESKIALMNMAMAGNLDLNIFQFLASIGYDEEVLDDYFKLKAEDYSQKGVIRFENEAYWDKDVNKVKDSDIYISTEDAPKSLLGRNFLKMKTQFCHMPVIMFSGK